MALALALVLTAPVHAQNYPERVIRIVSPYPPGGSVDVMARVLAAKLTEVFGSSVIVETRTGAGGNTGAEFVAKAEPDGYTLFFTAPGPLVINQTLYAKGLAFNPDTDFAPIALFGSTPLVMMVSNDLPANNVQELIALAKQKPGSINYASAGVGNFSHLAMELFSSAAGVKLQHVPYKGTAPAAQALLSGEVQVGFNNVQTLLQFVQEGKLKPLGVAEPKRIPQFPNYPAVAETVPGFEMAPWVGIVAPAGVPQAVIDKLNDTMLVVMNDPAIIKQFADQQLTVMALPKEKFGELIKADTEKWRKVVTEANIKLE
jgi:tripartite-type tricarboxylate transporter receptor subunit TctC